LQLLPAIILNPDTEKTCILSSYSKVEVPFNKVDEKVFEIGWRSKVEFNSILSP